MQQTRKPSFLKSILGLKKPDAKKSARKAPAPIDERQLHQVAGGGTETEPAGSPRGGW